MKNIIWVLLFAFGVLAFSACEQTGKTNTNAPANTVAAKPEEKPKVDVKAELVALENKAWEAFKSKDGKFFEGLLLDGFVSSGAGGRGTKADTVKGISESPCEVKSFTLSDTNVFEISSDAAIVTAKAVVDISCGGKAGQSPVYTASVFVKKGDKWQAAFHQELPADDAKPESAPPPPGSAKPWEDANKDLTTAIYAVEKGLWESWSKKDSKGFETGLFKMHSEIGGTGVSDRAKAIQDVAENKCEVKSLSQEDIITTKITETVALLTYKANLDAVCDGKPVPKHSWSSSVYLKDGDKWLSALYIGTPFG